MIFKSQKFIFVIKEYRNEIIGSPFHRMFCPLQLPG